MLGFTTFGNITFTLNCKTFLCFCILWFSNPCFQEVFGQCSTCDVVVDGNNPPSGTILNNSTVCIRGQRTTGISFNNRSGIMICIEDGASWNGSYSQLSGLGKLNNFGALTLSNDPNGSWTINNFNSLTFSGNLNSNKTINNYGELTFSGSTNINSNSTLNSNGSLFINGSVNFNSNATVSLSGQNLITGSAVINANTSIELGGSLTIGGALQVNSNGSISGQNTNSCNTLSVAGSFQNNGIISGNGLQSPDSPLYLNKNPNGIAPIGNYSIGSCPSKSCIEKINITTSGGYDVVYIFNCSGTFTVPALLPDEEILDVNLSLIGGGGGGGFGTSSGGGGAGGIFEASGLSLKVNQTYRVAVGVGGSGSSSNTLQGNNGTESVIFGYFGYGGGGGGSESSSARGGNSGGSGGGGAANNNPGNGSGNGGPNLNQTGNVGGNGKRQNSNLLSGGGGGGAGAAGDEGENNRPGNGGGGNSLTTLIGVPGVTNAFAGGGGATGRNPAQQYGKGTGGIFSNISLGGDGDNKDPGDPSTDGIGDSGFEYTGSGGGAGSIRGGAGSNGKVVIRISYRILPLNFGEIKATYKQDDRTSFISWSTLNEWEGVEFQIERAANQVKNWETIGKVKSKGEIGLGSSYQFLDTQLPKEGGFIYYRIKIINKDGAFGYSNVVSISVEKGQGKSQWNFFPNPVRDQKVTLKYLGVQNELKETISLSLLDLSGKNLTYLASDLEDSNRWLNDVLSKSDRGIFILTIQSEQEIHQFKILN